MMPQSPASERLLGRLTRQQRRVLLLLCEGRTNKQIADEIGVKATTIKTHVKGILGRLGANSRTQAVASLLRVMSGEEKRGHTSDRDVVDLSRRLDMLTERELEVLRRLRQGLLNKQIAYQLGVTPATVKAHVTGILRKLGVRSRTLLVVEVSDINLNTFRLEPRSDAARGPLARSRPAAGTDTP